MTKRAFILSTVSFFFVLCAATSTLCFCLGLRHCQKVAVDFSINTIEVVEREPKYKFLPAEISNYICDLCEGLKLDSDRAVGHLMVENPSFDPNAIHINSNGTIDQGEFQLNDRSTWTSFIPRYWFPNIEFDPFNWKHNTYVALHHMKYLDDKFKLEDDAIMAYNCGEGAVMNGTIPESTKVYLAKVKNNIWLLKNCGEE